MALLAMNDLDVIYISLEPHLSLFFSKYYNPVTLTSFEFFKYISLHYVLDGNIYWAGRSIIFIISFFAFLNTWSIVR